MEAGSLALFNGMGKACDVEVLHDQYGCDSLSQDRVRTLQARPGEEADEVERLCCFQLEVAMHVWS